MRPFSWGLGTGRDVEVNGTPVKGSFGARPQVASLFWCSSRVLLSTDTPLGSSMGSTMTSWVIGSRKSSGTGSALESGKNFLLSHTTTNCTHFKASSPHTNLRGMTALTEGSRWLTGGTKSPGDGGCLSQASWILFTLSSSSALQQRAG